MNISSPTNNLYNNSVVRNQRWIHRNQLKVGMYVSELDVAWEKTPFMFQGFYIETAEQLAEVQSHCEYLQVLTEKVAKKPMQSYNRMCGLSQRQSA